MRGTEGLRRYWLAVARSRSARSSELRKQPSFRVVRSDERVRKGQVPTGVSGEFEIQVGLDPVGSVMGGGEPLVPGTAVEALLAVGNLVHAQMHGLTADLAGELAQLERLAVAPCQPAAIDPERSVIGGELKQKPARWSWGLAVVADYCGGVSPRPRSRTLNAFRTRAM